MMAKDADPDWDVLTVRPSNPSTSQATFDVRGRHIIIGNRTVETILLLAYGLQKNQIVGGPDWVRTERFDADGIPTVEGQPSLEQFRSMLRKLLAERFGLVNAVAVRLPGCTTVKRGKRSIAVHGVKLQGKTLSIRTVQAVFLVSLHNKGRQPLRAQVDWRSGSCHGYDRSVFVSQRALQ